MFSRLKKWFRVKEDDSKLRQPSAIELRSLKTKTECSKFGGAFGSPHGGRSSRRFRRNSLK